MEQAATVDPALCPRCGDKLTNPDGLGWCPSCGYCRSLEEDGKTIAPPTEAATAKKPSLLGASEFGEAMRRMPMWFWPLFGGVLFLAGGSVAADYLLPEDGLARALWSAIQLVLGIVGVVVAQLWAALLVGTNEERIGARDVFLPGRIWRAVCQRLPETRKPLWLGTWCLTGLVCAIAIIGGFNYWVDLLTGNHLRDVALAAATSRQSEGRDTARESKVVDLPALSPLVDTKSVTQCVVIGYQDDGRGVTGLVLAANKGDHLYFVGILREGLSPNLRAELLRRLSQIERPEPLIPRLQLPETTWVNPGVFCDVIRSGDKLQFKELRD